MLFPALLGLVSVVTLDDKFTWGLESWLGWLIPWVIWIIPFSTVGQAAVSFYQKKATDAKSKDTRTFADETLNEALLGIILDVILPLKMQLTNGGSAHNMKVTVFVKKANMLEAIQRAGGVEGKKCEHTFPIAGRSAGVVGEAFQQESAITAYNLPDLNNLPAGKKGKDYRKEMIEDYATKVSQSTFEIEQELKHKIKEKRQMPRSMYALRVWSLQHNKTLGVIVVDSTNLFLTSDQEALVGEAGEALRPILLRLR